MKILVTGGAGFIASHIVDAYVGLGHDVVVLDNLVTGYRRNVNAKARFYEMDIREVRGVADLFSTEQFDVVNHHAAQIDVRRSVSDPVYDASVNILGVINLLECCAAHKVKKFIFASSGGAIYGEQDYFPADENHKTMPISPYGISKLTTEKYMYYYHLIHGLDAIALRYANVYGPRQNPEGEAGVVSIFTTRMQSRSEAVVNGSGEQTRDYVFVGDIVRANVLSLDQIGFEVLNVGTGIETNVNQLFRMINELTGANAPETHGPPKAGEQMRSVLSYEKIGKLLGWKPSVSLRDGLRQTVEFFKNSAEHGKKPA